MNVSSVLPEADVRTLVSALGLGDVVATQRLKVQNDIDRIVTTQGVFYCKS